MTVCSVLRACEAFKEIRGLFPLNCHKAMLSENPGALATRNMRLPPRRFVSSIPLSRSALPSLASLYCGSTAMPSTMNSPCLFARTNPPMSPAVLPYIPAFHYIRGNRLVFGKFQIVFYKKRYKALIIICFSYFEFLHPHIPPSCPVPARGSHQS